MLPAFAQSVALVATAAAILFSPCNCVAWAGQETQFRALLAKHFIQAHQAIPLFNDPDAKSGEVLGLPDELRLIPRERCYTLPPVRYTLGNSENTEAIAAVSAAAAVGLPIDDLAQVDAAVQGHLENLTSLRFDPFSQEAPPDGSVLWAPAAAANCDSIRAILSGQATSEILVTRVFHGVMQAELSYALSGGGQVSGELNKTISRLLGARAKAQLSSDGKMLAVTVAASPGPVSLAVQSGTINLRELARIYLAPKAESRHQLEGLVDDYLGTEDDRVMAKLKGAVASLLDQLGIDTGPRDKFYYRFFSGDGARPATPARLADVPQDRWAFAGVIAAACEIVAGD